MEQGQEVIAGKPEVVPSTEQVHRAGRGSLRGEIILAEDWHSSRTNAAIAADFGLWSCGFHGAEGPPAPPH